MIQRLAVGIDLGGTNLKIALVDQAGSILAHRIADADAAAGPATMIARCRAIVKALMAEVGVSHDDIIGVGLGSPGPLSSSRGIIFHAVNLPGWRNIPLRSDMAAALDLPVILENDGNAAAFGEYWAGVGQRRFDLVMFTLGTGVGGGVILGGEVLHGHFENAAELGHTIVEVDGLPCNCGKRGCLEQYASASAVAQRVKKAITGGEACLLFDRVQAGEAIDSEQVMEAARQGDSLCQHIVHEACRYLAMACVNVQHTFNPAKIVLGGGLAQAGDDFIMRVKAQVDQMRWQLCDDYPEITLGQLGYEAGMIGAACLAWQVGERKRIGEVTD